MNPITRRNFVRSAALATAGTRLINLLPAATPLPTPLAAIMPKPSRPGAAPVRWIDGQAPQVGNGATWGVAWPEGNHAADTAWAMRSVDGQPVPVQSWPLATWPDGSLKWSAHAIPADAPAFATGELSPGAPAAPARPLRASDKGDTIEIDTGVIRCVLGKSGGALVRSITRDGVEIARDGRLVCQIDDRSRADVTREEAFAGKIESAEIESAGPVRAVVKFEGKHAGEGRTWLPFVVRLYFYAGGDGIRALHTIIFDGDEDTDFISGLGLRLAVPLRGELYDRHVRFSGEDDGVFGEAVRGITGLRRDPGKAVRDAQVAGEPTPPVAEWAETVSSRLEYIPAYDDWTLVQRNADGFDIRKRTAEGYTWLTAAQGSRAGGLAYIGTPQGGVAAGIRNFWQSHPAQLDVSGAKSDAAELTLWFWAPDGPAMDLRSYHDGLGQDTYEEQYNGGLAITYEDYEEGFDTPMGVGRTSEVMIWALAATPTRERFAGLADALREPGVLAATPEHLAAAGVFGGMWSPEPAESTPVQATIDARLGWFFDFYQGQQEQRRWYGYWNYGDVMHTYDSDRHEWRYDVGGYAWDNSELSTDIWLWLYFLRSGRADVFRFAEAMTRHTGEVDTHHLGRFAPLGSRHNVLHWGCSAKQLRISTAVNRRYYYYLTADERTGDLMRAQIEAGRALLRVPPGRKLASAEEPGDLDRGASAGVESVGLSFGTDWGSLAGAWLTEWERTGSPLMKERLLNGMRTIGQQPHGFFTTGATINLETGAFEVPESGGIGISHLNAVFGLPEVCAELIRLLDVPEFRRAWLNYCELYNAPAEEQERRLGESFRGNLGQGHSRLTAYAAHLQNDAALGRRAWEEFFRGSAGYGPRVAKLESRELDGPQVLRPVDEAAWVSTNATAQWGLAAIQCLALVPEQLPEEI